MTFKTYQGADKSIQINVLDNLPTERYLLALRRIRKAIADGRPRRAYDDDTPGSKAMGCSWGLCHDSADTWPDAEDHIFPVQFLKTGRISYLPTITGQLCPMDRRKAGDDDPNGCFYTCRIFGGERVTNEQALKLYDERIAWAEAQLANKDDHEDEEDW